jgi:hypothetical protein
LVEVTPGLCGRLTEYLPDLEIQLASRLDHYLYSTGTSTRRGKRGSLSKVVRASIRLISTQHLSSDSVATSPKRRIRFLDGYFQHSTWYENQVSTICSELYSNRPANLPLELANVSAIHLRRSDYVRLGWVLTWAYYESVIESIQDSPSITTVLVLSDDQLVENLFSESMRRKGFAIFPNDEVHPRSARRDLYLLSAAESIYMSNSTFSWWAAQLGAFRMATLDRRIFCPGSWLPNGTGNSVIDPTWSRLSD